MKNVERNIVSNFKIFSHDSHERFGTSGLTKVEPDESLYMG